MTRRDVLYMFFQRRVGPLEGAEGSLNWPYIHFEIANVHAFDFFANSMGIVYAKNLQEVSRLKISVTFVVLCSEILGFS